MRVPATLNGVATTIERRAESGILGHMLIARRVALLLGLALLVAAAVLMLWPLHANGVSGNALQPHYTSFGVEAYAPIPTHPTRTDFVKLGIAWPHDIVHDRRVLSAAIAAGGAFLLIAAAALRPRRRDPLTR